MVDVEVDHHKGDAEYDEFPYGYRCTGCDQPWPCPGFEAAQAERPARAVVHHERSAIDGSCVGCGFAWPCPVASRRRSLEDLEITLRSLAAFGCHLEAFEGNSWQATKGGIVVDFCDDDEGRRTFTVLNWYRGAGPYTADVALDDVEPASLALPRPDVVRDTGRRLGRWVGQQVGPAGGDEVRWLRFAIDLLEAAT
jgi:hypothetical protein